MNKTSLLWGIGSPKISPSLGSFSTFASIFFSGTSPQTVTYNNLNKRCNSGKSHVPINSAITIVSNPTCSGLNVSHTSCDICLLNSNQMVVRNQNPWRFPLDLPFYFPLISWFVIAVIQTRKILRNRNPFPITSQISIPPHCVKKQLQHGNCKSTPNLSMGFLSDFRLPHKPPNLIQ